MLLYFQPTQGPAFYRWQTSLQKQTASLAILIFSPQDDTILVGMADQILHLLVSCCSLN